ncbi:hypothetical protein E2562_012006 [Oryza meyeriana var. granulata]|uniref:Uncharacterized protein n=1 Tax=Oryza meyeriana var. granulata TaxID=110450 RepID=A0A6G1F7D2_9ORYZ|nr:hypothetical protein E2562_012006 [Oryza meyeriana var. granulata]
MAAAKAPGWEPPMPSGAWGPGMVATAVAWTSGTRAGDQEPAAAGSSGAKDGSHHGLLEHGGQGRYPPPPPGAQGGGR